MFGESMIKLFNGWDLAKRNKSQLKSLRSNIFGNIGRPYDRLLQKPRPLRFAYWNKQLEIR